MNKKQKIFGTLFVVSCLILLFTFSKMAAQTEQNSAATVDATQVSGQTLSKYPLDPTEVSAVQKVIDDYLPSRMLDYVWKNLFSYRTNFEAATGFTISTTASAGSVTFNSDNVNLTTGSTSTNFAELSKDWLNIGIPTFSQPSNFRTSFSFTATPANLTAYIVCGSIGSTGTSYYGFKVVNGTLYGVTTKNGTTGEQTIQLVTNLTSNVYSIEARYVPSKGVTFFVGIYGQSLALAQTPRGVLTKALPNPALSVNQNIMDIKLTTNTAAAKSLTVSYFEYLQVKSKSSNN